MIGLERAQQLKDAGLTWLPEQGDRFAVSGAGMDDRWFVINDMATIIESIQGFQAVTFHGVAEWALDYVWLGEAIWLPTEGQLRALLAERLAAAGSTVYDLLFADGVFTCRFELGGEALAFTASDAEDAYAAGLLHLIR
jgi:hypothetical protein